MMNASLNNNPPKGAHGPMRLQFGKYKGRLLGEVPLGYLKWWKVQLIENLRDCGGEIERREALGLTEDVETKLSVLPEHTRLDLLMRLEAAQNDDDRVHSLWLIDVKFREYSGLEPAAPHCDNQDDEEVEP
jgi:hypothetical protein